MSEIVAVVVTDSDADTAPIVVAKRFGFELAVLRYPSIEAIAQRVPDLILFDWSPSAVVKNTTLVREIRSAPAIRDVPIFIFYSDEGDVPTAVRSTDRVVSFQIPVGPDVVERALRRLVQGMSSSRPDHAAVPPAANSAHSRIHLLLRRFHTVALQLQERHPQRQGLKIDDEYDVQYLLRALLRLFFDDVRPEEWTPSYAGKSSKVDFLLKNERIVVEVKMTRSGLGPKEVGDQLIIDIERYRKMPDCGQIICFVYDPGNRIANPLGFERDLNRDEGGLRVEVVVLPKSH